MRIESSVTSISWIPAEAVEGMPKMPFSAGVAHYDDPPPETIDDIDAMREADLFREANELRAWVEVDDDGKIVDYAHEGRGHIGVTRLSLARREVSVPAVALPTLQPDPEAGDGWVRFTQTAGGRTGAPAPRRVRGKPFFQIASALAWTTLGLTIKADGSSEIEVAGASPFPRHWVYDHEGKLVQKSGLIDFKNWYREAFEPNTPWGGEDSEAVITAVESELERELSAAIMSGKKRPKPSRLKEGQTLVKQGEPGDTLFLLFDGMLSVEVDDEQVAQVGPGAILGERAVLEGGERMATLRAMTPCKVITVAGDQLDPDHLAEVARTRA
jgi:hypothetical protein